MLFDAFWQLAAPDGWQLPESSVIYCEYSLGEYGRIDICIECSGKEQDTRFLGIEVKTDDKSTTTNQLYSYYKGLNKTHPSSDIAIVYLTPFNRDHAKERASTFRAIGEFDEFEKKVEGARHLSWLDVAAIEWDGGDIWRQHQSYVRNEISALRKLEEN